MMTTEDQWEALAEVQLTRERIYDLLDEAWYNAEEHMDALVAEFGDHARYEAQPVLEWLGF